MSGSSPTFTAVDTHSVGVATIAAELQTLEAGFSARAGVFPILTGVFPTLAGVSRASVVYSRRCRIPNTTAWNHARKAPRTRAAKRALMRPKYVKVRMLLDFPESGAALALGGRRRRRTAVTQQAVERALGKLLTDENFRERFFTNPEIASWEAGFTLSPIELEALSQVSHEALARSSLDPDRREAGKAACRVQEGPRRGG